MNVVGAGCIGMLIMLVIVVAIGGYCTDYVVHTCWGKDFPSWADCCIGLFTGEIVVPAAIVCFIVKACDVPTPFFDPPVAATQPAI
jgi:hypothetical protein